MSNIPPLRFSHSHHLLRLHQNAIYQDMSVPQIPDSPWPRYSALTQATASLFGSQGVRHG